MSTGAEIDSATPVEPVAASTEHDDDNHVPVASAAKCDRYGFMTDDHRSRATAVSKKDSRKESERTVKWIKMIKNWDKYIFQKEEKLKNRIRKGIPDSVRGTVWPLLINVNLWKTKYPGAMNPELISIVSSQTRDDITKDLNRTYPRHEIFSERGFGQESLERVLLQYAAHDVTTNYCQGMGFIAGMFLMYMDEETAFYCMIGALEVHTYLCHFLLSIISRFYTHRTQKIPSDYISFLSLLK